MLYVCVAATAFAWDPEEQGSAVTGDCAAAAAAAVNHHAIIVPLLTNSHTI